MKRSNNYLLFWLSQAISELGSMMTVYALIIWSYTQTQSVMSVSLLSFFTFAPKALVSISLVILLINTVKKYNCDNRYGISIVFSGSVFTLIH